MSTGDAWQNIRVEQDRAIERAGYLSEAKARRKPWRPARRRVPGRWGLAAAASLAVASAAGWTLSAHWRGPRDVGFLVGAAGQPGDVGAWIAAPSGTALPLQFSDGTLFSLEAGSRARVSGVDANGARIVLERGRANATVVHRPASHWLVDVGPFAVTVVGTRFDVSWDADEEVFRLKLLEGSVLVSGPCLREPRRLAQGHLLRVLCKGGGREEIVETAGEGSEAESRRGVSSSSGDGAGQQAAETLLPAESRAPETGPARTDTRGPAAESSGTTEKRNTARRAFVATDVVHSDAWRTLTSAGRYRESLELVERSGFERECASASGAALLELGDVARFAGNSARARQAYLAARGKLPGGGRSTYSLGLTAFDREKDFALAARWFEVYLSEQRDGELRREAEGRLMEAWQRAGDPERARLAAEQYLRSYPDGTQAPLARQLITR